MEYVKEKAKISLRMNALIQNLCYRRQINWIVPEYRHQVPKLMKDIHSEYEKLILMYLKKI